MSALDQAWTAWQQSTLLARWKVANPHEWQLLNAYRLGGTRPVLVTPVGRALIYETDAWLAQIIQPPPPPPPPPSTGFVTRDGARLMLDGNVFTFKGINCYGALGKCGPTITIVDDLPSGAVLRFWAFRSQVATDWQNLDNLVDLAHRSGRLLLPVLSNAYPDCNGQTDDATFGQYIGTIADRYRNEPAILMWQLINEGGKTASWYTTMAAKIKVADPNHLVSFGAYNNKEHPTVYLGDDAVDIHRYYEATVPLPAWLQNNLAIAKSAGIPVIVGEAGISDELDPSQRRDDFKAWFDAMFAAGVSGVLLWGWRTLDGFGIQAGDPALGLLA